MILIFEFGLILLWVLTGNSKVQLAQYFEVNNLKKKKKTKKRKAIWYDFNFWVWVDFVASVYK